MKTQTVNNNIAKLVQTGIISVDLPKMGGIVVINGVEYDNREYYSGRGSKYNKNINHEKVVVKITQKEVAKAIRHLKMSIKWKNMRDEAMEKAFSKSRPSYNRNVTELWKTMQYAFTKGRKIYFPEIKELARVKIQTNERIYINTKRLRENATHEADVSK